VTEREQPSGPLDIATLEVLARRAHSHPLVDSWAWHPDSLSPRRLELSLDAGQYPRPVTDVRLDVRWFDGRDYTFHYLETREEMTWQCRWDRHPKPTEPRAHFHPPPDASAAVEESDVDETHHLGVLFAVLEWVESRIGALHQT